MNLHGSIIITESIRVKEAELGDPRPILRDRGPPQGNYAPSISARESGTRASGLSRAQLWAPKRATSEDEAVWIYKDRSDPSIHPPYLNITIIPLIKDR